jgi:hypothetical protein
VCGVAAGCVTNVGGGAQAQQGPQLADRDRAHAYAADDAPPSSGGLCGTAPVDVGALMHLLVLVSLLSPAFGCVGCPIKSAVHGGAVPYTVGADYPIGEQASIG